jgi:hypothetical protein
MTAACRGGRGRRICHGLPPTGGRIGRMHLGCELRGKTIEEGRYAMVVPCISCPLVMFAQGGRVGFVGSRD